MMCHQVWHQDRHQGFRRQVRLKLPQRFLISAPQSTPPCSRQAASTPHKVRSGAARGRRLRSAAYAQSGVLLRLCYACAQACPGHVSHQRMHAVLLVARRWASACGSACAHSGACQRSESTQSRPWCKAVLGAALSPGRHGPGPKHRMVRGRTLPVAMGGQLRVLQGPGLRLEHPCTRATFGADGAVRAQVPGDHHIHHGSGAPAACHAQGCGRQCTRCARVALPGLRPRTRRSQNCCALLRRSRAR